MAQKLQLTPDGMYVGPAQADPSPLESGVLLWPAHTVEAAPPEFDPLTQSARWSGAAWEIAYLPGQSPEERLATARAVATSRTVAFANTIRERIANSKHYLQAARWPIQLAAAQAIKASAASEFDTSIMAREARLRGLGETVEQLADKVLANSLIFASVGAAVDGIERATLDAIAAYAGTDPAQFEVILTDAKATALAEFLDIFGAVYGPAQAQAMAAQFFGPQGG